MNHQSMKYPTRSKTQEPLYPSCHVGATLTLPINPARTQQTAATAPVIHVPTNATGLVTAPRFRKHPVLFVHTKYRMLGVPRGARMPDACTCYNCCCWCSLPATVENYQLSAHKTLPRIHTDPQGNSQVNNGADVDFPRQRCPYIRTTPHDDAAWGHSCTSLGGENITKIVNFTSSGILIVKYSVDQL